MKADRVLKVLSYVAFPLLVAVILLLAWLFRAELWTLFSSPRALHDLIAQWGVAAPLLFIAIQVLQVLIFVIPGEVPQAAGGYLFGTWLGSLFSLIGIVIGSTGNFYLGRLLGVPFVRSVFGEKRLSQLGKILSARRTTTAFFLLFVIPGVPKDALCYVAGVSRLSFGWFLLVSTIGRLPGILGSSAMGGAAAKEMWLTVGFIVAAAVVLFFIGFLYRDQLRTLVERLLRVKATPNGDDFGQK